MMTNSRVVMSKVGEGELPPPFPVLILTSGRKEEGMQELEQGLTT